jgi:hypothetical protein
MAKLTEGPTLKDTGGETVLLARTTLVLYHRDGATVAHLEKGRSFVVGRAAPSEVEIPELGLSRQHARFTWDDHGLWVEDLGSTNGTKKNGEVVKRARIAPGDEIAVGPVMVSIHVLSSIDEELRGFDGHDRFVAALSDELTRARTFARPLALMMVRSANTTQGHVSRWASGCARGYAPWIELGSMDRRRSWCRCPRPRRRPCRAWSQRSPVVSRRSRATWSRSPPTAVPSRS